MTEGLTFTNIGLKDAGKTGTALLKEKSAVELRLARPGQQQKGRKRSKRMRDAQYLRAQAEFCLEVSRQVSDHTAVENLQAEAARYHAEAVEVEAEDHPGSVGDPKAAVPTTGAALRTK